jgi:dTDP-4-amino-4,6-dideoxygalactose transaminase
VLASGQFVLGPEVEAFEQEFARSCATAHAVGVSSGTSALHLALLAAGVGPGDDVITVPFTFVATVAAVHYAGARPVFVDVEPGTLTMDPARLEAALTPATKAIIPVHLHGQCADMGPILQIARAHGLTVIEDAAQAHGATYRGRPAGSLGDLGCFSFYPTKNLGAAGEGGMVVSGNDALVRRVRLLRDWGQEEKHRHVLKGYNYRLEALQAAILRVKLRHLPAWTAARVRNAARLSAGLRGASVRVPTPAPERGHVFHVYAVRSPRRDALAAHLREHGIATGIHYPVPVHLQEAYRDPRYGPGDFPVSEEAARSVLSLPMFPELTAAQIDTIVQEIASFEGAARG